jgi:hypothetical protein
MAEGPDFTIRIEPDAGRPGRYRWNILENGKPRDKSTYSYPTHREAQADAEKFVQKLRTTWGPSNG